MTNDNDNQDKIMTQDKNNDKGQPLWQIHWHRTTPLLVVILDTVIYQFPMLCTKLILRDLNFLILRIFFVKFKGLKLSHSGKLFVKFKGPKTFSFWETFVTFKGHWLSHFGKLFVSLRDLKLLFSLNDCLRKWQFLG